MELQDHENEFRAAIIETAKAFNLQEHIIEKDYWVTMLLRKTALSKYKDYVVFKGGTSLSKAFNLINRFSEDVDLALRPEAISPSGIHKRTGDAIHKLIKEIKLNKFCDIPSSKESEKLRYKRAYKFPTLFSYPEESPIHEQIILEINAYSNPLPIELTKINSLIGLHLANNISASELKELNVSDFYINALSPERTFCEKILAIRRAAHKGNEFFGNRIRHVYDIYVLLQTERISKFFAGDDFIKILDTCYKDDKLNQIISSEANVPINQSIVFTNPRSTLDSAKSSYNNLKSVTFDGKLPSISEITEILEDIHLRLRDLEF